jgi:hypothetical protein
VVTLWWPQNGAQISGSSFTWRGTVDDPTVTLSAQITDTNGDVNVVAGVIERNGNFWVDNLPLAPGTNWLTLTATDINNHVTSTNIYVVQSSVGLSITTSDAITTQTAIGVSGTIGASGYLVWVNGVLANQSGGNWTAYNVPVNGDGVQVIQVCAIPNTPADNYGYGTGSGGGGTNSSLSNPGNPSARDAVCAEYNPEKEPVIICVGYHQSWSGQGGITNNYWQSSETINWSPTGGGSIVSNYSLTYYSDWLTSQTQSQWDSNGVGSTVTTSTGFVNGVTNNPTPITNAYDGPTSFGGLQGQTYGMDAGSGSPAATGSITAMPDYLLEAQGYGLSGWQRLLWLSLGASQVVDPWYPAEGDPLYWDISSTPVPYSQQMILGHREGSDGFLVTTVPSDAVIKVQLMVLGQSSDTVSPGVADGDPVITANTIALNPVALTNGANFSVGQNVAFALGPMASGVTATNFHWTFTGKYFNAYSNAVPGATMPTCSLVPYVNTNYLSNNTATNWWVSGGAAGSTNPNIPAIYEASASFDLLFTNGNPPQHDTAVGQFAMYRPCAKITAQTTSVTVNEVNEFNNDWCLIFSDCRTDLSQGAMDNGIVFKNIISFASNFPGSVQWVQIISSANQAQGTNSTNYSRIQSGPGPYLDTAIPYSGYLPLDPSTPVDMPDDDLDSFESTLKCNLKQVVRSDSFEMYMEYQPSAGSNWVPLRGVNWSWSGTATNGPNGWGLQTGTNSANPPDFDVQDYPIWRSNYTNAAWSPQL